MINGSFELVGALLTFYNCSVLLKDRKVAGINPWVTVYFAGWALWNCFWYPSLNQPYSFYGGIAITVANMTWILILVWINFKRKHLSF